MIAWLRRMAVGESLNIAAIGLYPGRVLVCGWWRKETIVKVVLHKGRIVVTLYGGEMLTFSPSDRVEVLK